MMLTRTLLILTAASAAVFGATIGPLERASVSPYAVTTAPSDFSSFILYFQADYSRSVGPTVPALTPIVSQTVAPADGATTITTTGGGASATPVAPLFITQPNLGFAVLLIADYTALGPDAPIVNPGQHAFATASNTAPVVFTTQVAETATIAPAAAAPMTPVEVAAAGVSDVFIDTPIQQVAVAEAGAIYAGDTLTPTVLVNTATVAPDGTIIVTNGAPSDPSAPTATTTTDPAADPTSSPALVQPDFLTAPGAGQGIPEPSTSVGVACGLAGLFWLRSRKGGIRK